MKKLNVINDFSEVFELKFNYILDIGSGNGDALNEINNVLKVPNKNIHTFEPNEKLYNQINEKYPDFNNNKLAVFNNRGKAHFNLVSNHDGISSLYYRDVYANVHPATSVEVDTTTGEYIIDTVINAKTKNKNTIALIDACGVSYEILNSFNDKISNISFIVVSTEKEEFYKGQKLDNEVRNYLVDKGFIYIHQYSDYPNEFVSFYINNNLI